MTGLSTLRAGSGGLDGGENHEGKRREKEKEDILFKFGRLAWKVQPCALQEASARVRLLLLPAATTLWG